MTLKGGTYDSMTERSFRSLPVASVPTVLFVFLSLCCFFFHFAKKNEVEFFASDFFNLLLVRFHQAEIIIAKHLTFGRNNEAWVGVEPSTLRSWPSYNDAPNHSTT